MVVNLELRPYQKIGIEFLYKRAYALLADDFGLGKSAQSLKATRGDKILIVCPNTLRQHWIDEILKWVNHQSLPITEVTADNRTISVPAYRVGYMIIGYDTLKLLPELAHYPFSDIIIDEAHHIRNRHTKRSKAVRRLIAGHKIALSATPIINRPWDLWAVLNFLAPRRFASYWKWVETFVQLEKTPWGWKPIGLRLSTKGLLTTLLGEFTLARTIDEEMPELPQLIYIPCPLVLPASQQKVHNQILSEIFVEVDRGILTIQNALVAMVRARQLTAHPPLIGVDETGPKLEFLLDTLEGIPAYAVVIFSQFVKLHKVLAQHIPNLIIINGEVDIKERIRRLKEFQQHGGVLVGNQPILGEGVDLSMADLLVWYDKPWSPEWMKQARARIRRFGLKRPVRELDLIVKGSIEDEIEELLFRKGLSIKEMWKILRQQHTIATSTVLPTPESSIQSSE